MPQLLEGRVAVVTGAASAVSMRCRWPTTAPTWSSTTSGWGWDGHDEGGSPADEVVAEII